jgi:adenine-specific DNA-methyltransferase
MVELIWDNKQEMLAEINSDTFYQTNKKLIPCIEESENFDNTENLYIEGDNLDALKLLKKDYESKVKMIYIDPPYNTEKKFMYNDTFRNKKKKECRHSGWLNMMYPRLRLARNLLTDDGVIFISIDDNELQNLRKICDEIYGVDNFKGQVTRVTGTPTGQGTDSLVKEADYILIYSKSNEFWFKGIPFTGDDEKIYNQNDEFGVYLTRPLRKTGGEDRREDRPSMYYPVTAPNGAKVFPIAPSGYESRWRCGEERYKELCAQNLIEWKESDGEWKVYQKFYLEGRTKQVSNLWSKLEGNKKATIEVKTLLGTNLFDFPKPVQLLKQILQISCQSNDVILDFFSGSATTAHAVMQLNAEDNGNRKFICVQLPEPCDENSEAFKAGYKNICEIGKERIRRAGEKIHEEKPDAVFDDGFKVFKLI